MQVKVFVKFSENTWEGCGLSRISSPSLVAVLEEWLFFYLNVLEFIV